MQKPLISLAVVGALLATSTSIAYADTVNYSKYSYLEKVKTDNFDLDQISDKLDDEIKEYKLALRAKQTVEEMTFKEFDDNYKDTASRLNAANIKLYNPIAEGKEYHDKYIEKKQKENQILLEGEANYFNYINAEKSLKNSTDSFNLTKEKYDTKVLEHQLGKISDIDLLTFEKTYNDSYVAQLQAQNAYEQAKNTFNKYISEPISTDVTLEPIDIVLPNYKLTSIDDTLKKMLDNSYQMSALTLELDRLKAERAVKGRYSGFSNTKIELEKLEISTEETEKKIEDMKLDLEYQLRTKYNDTIAAENSFKSAELSLQIEENNLKVSKIKSDNQMISAQDYLNSKQTYDKALNSYFSAKLSAYKAIRTFNDFIELNTTPVKMDLK